MLRKGEHHLIQNSRIGPFSHRSGTKVASDAEVAGPWRVLKSVGRREYNNASRKLCLNITGKNWREFMKKILSGISFLFFGLTLYITAHIQAVNYLPLVTSWNTDKGKYWSALDETHGIQLTYFGITFCVLGTILILIGCFEDQIKKIFKTSSSKQEETRR